MSDLQVGDRVRVLSTGEMATITATTVPYMRLVRVDGDDFEIHINTPNLPGQEAGMSERAATIELMQLPNGYWRGVVSIQVPGLAAPHEQEGNSFHDAGEVLDWARMTISLFVANVPSPSTTT